jgi:hypothetical protein
MEPCAHSLFDGIIDYAGLFPPAQLSMDEAYERFIEHRSSDDGWMLARFVCPATRLCELQELITSAEQSDVPVLVSVLGSGGEKLESFLASVKEDEQRIASFAAELGDRARTDVYEVRLPQAGGAAVAVNQASLMVTKGWSRSLTPFFEVSLLGDWRPRLPAAAAAVRDTDRQTEPGSRVGLKIRCGGLDASAVPDAEAVAAAIATCRATKIPLKATQGLHHPFRHHDAEMQAMVHGFVNLFTASVLAHVHDLPVKTLIDVVSETDPEAFVLGPDQLSWREHEASAEQVAAARGSVLTTFGSCSFSEPRDDLRELGYV